METEPVDRDGIPMALVKHALIDTHSFTLLGVDMTCLKVDALIGSELARKCYLMTTISLLYKYKIDLLGMIWCFNPTTDAGSLAALPSLLSDQSYSNVCVAYSVQIPGQELPANSELSKKMQQGWKLIPFDGDRTSVQKIILSIVEPEQPLTFQTKLIDEKGSLSVVGGWSSWIWEEALYYRGNSYVESIYWDFQCYMDESTSILLHQDVKRLGIFTTKQLAKAHSAGGHSTYAIRNVAATAMHFNDLLAARRAVLAGGLVYEFTNAIAWQPTSKESGMVPIFVATPPSEASKGRSSSALEPNVGESLSGSSVEGSDSLSKPDLGEHDGFYHSTVSVSQRAYVDGVSPEKTLQAPPPRPRSLPGPRLSIRASDNIKSKLNDPHTTGEVLSTGTSELYVPLNDSQIRLVNLLAGQEEDKIRLSLAVVDLVELPKFEALSYVVGRHDHSKSAGITHRGVVTQLPISKTLETVLIILRRKNMDRMLWIDAISINQNDQAERSAQIKKMGQIFHAASNVCIWLGPASVEEQSRDAIEFIPKMLDFKTLDQTLKDKINKPLWLALSRLMARDWWQRRWMVQEMALARTATVYCGSSRVPWSDFAAAADIFESRWLEIREALGWESAEELGDVHVPGASSLVSISSGVFQKDSLGNIQRRCFDLETLIAILPIFAVTEPLDSVYSILSLGRDTYELKNLNIPLDYTLSPKRVFVSVVEHIVNVSESLDVICRPWAPNGALPSWIPTVDKYAYTRRHDGQYERENANSLVGLPGRPIYSASGRRSYPEGVQVEWTGDQPALRVRGCTLGVIGEVGDRCVNGNIPRDWHSMGQWDRNQGQVPDAYWRTIVADRGLHGEQPPAWFRDVCTHCFQQNTLRDVDTSRLMRRLKSSHAREWLRRVQVTIWNRRLFQADLNDSLCLPVLGLGPAEARSGDFIVILQGCSVPVILRQSMTGTAPDINSWTLVGACFVHGRMDGEFSFERSYGERASEYRLV